MCIRDRGHDVDVTLVDFAADARAATPSQAAEMVVPDRDSRRQLLRRTGMHLARAVHARLSRDSVGLARATGRLGDPRLVIAAHQQSLDERSARLAACMHASFARRHDLSLIHISSAATAREAAEQKRLETRQGAYAAVAEEAPQCPERAQSSACLLYTSRCV